MLRLMISLTLIASCESVEGDWFAIVLVADVQVAPVVSCQPQQANNRDYILVYDGGKVFWIFSDKECYFCVYLLW